MHDTAIRNLVYEWKQRWSTHTHTQVTDPNCRAKGPVETPGQCCDPARGRCADMAGCPPTLPPSDEQVAVLSDCVLVWSVVCTCVSRPGGALRYFLGVVCLLSSDSSRWSRSPQGFFQSRSWPGPLLLPFSHLPLSLSSCLSLSPEPPSPLSSYTAEEQ